jgi:hypothetical protein
MSKALAASLGITYRQLDHWTRQGWLKPDPRPVAKSGTERHWPDAELAIASDMGLLIRHGLTPPAAHRIARAGRTEAVLIAIRGDALDAMPAGVQIAMQSAGA